VSPEGAISGALRRAVASSGLTPSGVARLVATLSRTNFDFRVVHDLARAEPRTLLSTADKLAAALGVSAAGSSDVDLDRDRLAPLTRPLMRALATSQMPWTEVAKLVGVSNSTISRFAGGKTSLTLKTADALAAALGVSMSSDAGWVEEAAREAARLERPLSWVVQRAWRIARRGRL
jgi:transcriptional regulator with XRE-family HTH domain